MIQITFAVLAGILTITAPCILPMLPILLGASIGQENKFRPLFIVSGFITSFTLTGLFLSYLITHLGLPVEIIRTLAIILLVVFALLMIWPKFFAEITTHLNGLINRANNLGNKDGNMGPFVLGLVIGLIWTPCAGPVLGAILTLIATQGSTMSALILLGAYSLGAGIPMLAIAYGGQYITTRISWIAKYSEGLQKTFGVLVLILAVAMFFQIDTKIQAVLIDSFPSINIEKILINNNGNPINQGGGSLFDNIGANLTDSNEFKDYGPAPEFNGIENWLNTSSPISIKSLKGRVVLIDFWTYTCINCIRTLPYVTKWYDTYKDQGLVVVGVHTPEFAFEKLSENVKTAIEQFKIHYPVAQDNNYATWSAYGNQYWPAEYLINQDGKIVFEHFGEGNYDKTENAIKELLKINANSTVSAPPSSQLEKIQSPEMYLGTDRLANLTSSQNPSSIKSYYNLPSNLKLNTFALSGNWQFFPDRVENTDSEAAIELKFSSGKLFMVASAEKPTTLEVTVDGVKQPNVIVRESRLYPLFDSSSYSEHKINIKVLEAGLKAFTFTFG